MLERHVDFQRACLAGAHIVATGAFSAADAPAVAQAGSAIRPRSCRIFWSTPGTYAAHLHSQCDGRQSFHIIVLQSLRVAGGERGSFEIPRSRFDRGLCVILYSNTSLSRVLASRAI